MEGEPQVWDLTKEAFVDANQPDITPALFGEFTAPDGRPLRTAMSMMLETSTWMISTHRKTRLKNVA